MNNEERKQIIEILKSGEMLSSEWSSVLFPNQRRECELVYDGKAREEDILAETMSVPLQQTRLFGNNGNGWHNKLIFGDNLQIMKSLLEDKKKGKLCNADGTPGIRLVYIDPPFSTKKEMQGTGGAQAYQDKLVAGEFLEFLRKRLILIRELLSDDGSVYVHLDWRMNSYVRVLMDEVFGKENFLNEFIWWYGGGGRSKQFWGRKHDTVLFFKKGTQGIFNADDVRIPHAWTDGQLRADGSDRDERGMLPDDVWKHNAVMPWGSEKTGYPTQKPEDLLGHLIKASSNKQDIVADFFLGSGTTVAVAEKFGRRWIGTDCGKLAIYATQKRLLNLREDISHNCAPLKVKPFALYNAGLYELDKLSEESSENWNRFVLQLFQCREDAHKVGGIQMQGKLRGKSVLIYNPQDLKGGEGITEETIQDIHSSVGKMVGGQMFVIAPAMSFGFFQDYIDCENVRYYALRIPYSIINELHRRDFTALRQPENENAVNETVEAVGFDFNRRPKLKCSTGVATGNKNAFIKIETFKSDARIPEALQMNGNRETLSMVMLDYDYDSRKGIFEFDEVFYADDLKKNKWTVRFPSQNIGEHVMAIFIDIYGNEARELIVAKDFKKPTTVSKITRNGVATKRKSL